MGSRFLYQIHYMINTAIDVLKNTMLYTFYNYPVTYNYCFTNGHTP